MADASFEPYQKWFGIPPDEQPPNHYRLLGLELYEDSQPKIEDAVAAQVEFLQALSMGEHVAHAQRILNEVALARICLVNRDRKQAYDDQLRNPVDPNAVQKSIPFAKLIAPKLASKLALDDLKTALDLRKSEKKSASNQEAARRRSARSTTDQNVRVSSREPTPNIDSEPQTSSRIWLAAIAIGIVVVAGLGTGAYLWFGPSNQPVANTAPSKAPGQRAEDRSKQKINPANTDKKSPAKTRSQPNDSRRSKKAPPPAKAPNSKIKSDASPSIELASANRALINVVSNAHLVAYWPLNDGPANSTVTGADDIIDDSTHGATDALANGNGDKWVFDPSRNRIVLSTTEKNRLNAGTQDIDLNQGFSWSLWANVASSNKTDVGADVLIGTRRGGFHKLGPSGINNWANIGGYDLADDTWHHIAYVGDAANGVSLYIDGNLIGTDRKPSAATYNGVLEIGGSSQFTEDVTARISDVAIWDKRLSEARIMDLANGGNVMATSAEAGIVVDDFASFPLSGQGGVYQIDLGAVAPKFDASDSDKLVVMTGNRGSGGQNWGKDLTGISYGDNAMIEAVKLKSGDKGIPEEVGGIYYLDNPGAEKTVTISYTGKMNTQGAATLLALSGTASGVSVSSKNVTDGTVTSTSTSLTTKVDASIVLAVCVTDGKNPLPASPLNASNVGRSQNYAASGQVVDSAGKVVPTFSMSPGTTPLTAAVAFAPNVVIAQSNTARPNFSKLSFANPDFAAADFVKTSAKPNAANQTKPDVARKPPPPSKASPKAPGEFRLQDFAKAFELPPTSDVSPRTIGELVLSDQFLLGLKLFVADGATRNKVDFEMTRALDDKQKWIVSKNEKEVATPIAQFWKTKTEFCFQWLEAAASDENVNYLRNAALKLETSDEQSAWLSLRQPVLIEGFQLSADKPSILIKSDVSWLPNPNSIVVEVLSFPDTEIPSHCMPEFVTKLPAKMYFTRDEKKAFVWLEVDASHRTDHHRLEARLKVNIQGKVKPLKPSEISQYQQYFMDLGTNAEKQLAAIKDPKEKTQATEIVKAAKTTGNIFGEYTKIFPKVCETAIPVAIYMNVEDHQVQIARTASVNNSKK